MADQPETHTPTNTEGAPAVAAQWSEHNAPTGRKYYYNSVTGESTWERPAEFTPSTQSDGAPRSGSGSGGQAGYQPQGQTQPTPHPQAYGGYPQPYGQPIPYAHAYGGPGYMYPYGQAYGYAPHVAGPGPPIQTTESGQGPPGCNLFVFHIPNDMTNQDLFNYFGPYGTVISARIMVEKETGRSRGFGFVSYDNAASADQAIKAMNGFQVGRKRLKVQHKKEKTPNSSFVETTPTTQTDTTTTPTSEEVAETPATEDTTTAAAETSE